MTDPRTSRPRANPCWDSGPVGCYARALLELTPIGDLPMHDTRDAYPDCQPRTPIDPVARILSPGLMRGNTDLLPATWVPRAYRPCPTCDGRGVLPRNPWAKAPGDLMCGQCRGVGTVKL